MPDLLVMNNDDGDLPDMPVLLACRRFGSALCYDRVDPVDPKRDLISCPLEHLNVDNFGSDLIVAQPSREKWWWISISMETTSPSCLIATGTMRLQ